MSLSSRLVLHFGHQDIVTSFERAFPLLLPRVIQQGHGSVDLFVYITASMQSHSSSSYPAEATIERMRHGKVL